MDEAYKLIDRLKEPSTWAAIAAALAAFGIVVPDWAMIASAGVAVAALLGGLLPEKKAALALLVAGGLAVSACTPAQLQLAQTDISGLIQATCTDVMAAQKLNPASPVAPWAVGGCGNATSVAALVQNSETLKWLGKLQTDLAAPAPVAATPTS